MTELPIDILRLAPNRGHGVGCFAMVRDELHLMPAFFAHHRALGVGDFVVFDDGSTDGTRDWLLAQPDCTVLASALTYHSVLPGGAMFHHRLKNDMPERFGGDGRWFLVLDADELLVLPTRFATVDDVAGWLDHRGLRSAHAPMIGFHAETLALRNRPLGDPFVTSPWFDRSPGFVRVAHERAPRLVAGGIRYRLWAMLKERFPADYERVFAGTSYRHIAPWKVPLAKTGVGIGRPNSHAVTIKSPMGIELGVAHFKFHDQLDAKVLDAITRQNHQIGSIEYRFLDAVLARLSDVDLVAPKESVRYEGPASLETAGLIWAD